MQTPRVSASRKCRSYAHRLMQHMRKLLRHHHYCHYHDLYRDRCDLCQHKQKLSRLYLMLLRDNAAMRAVAAVALTGLHVNAALLQWMPMMRSLPLLPRAPLLPLLLCDVVLCHVIGHRCLLKNYTSRKKSLTGSRLYRNERKQFSTGSRKVAHALDLEGIHALLV